jgi:hypothetical protein
VPLITFFEDILEGMGIDDPFEQPAFFIQGHHSISPDICANRNVSSSSFIVSQRQTEYEQSCRRRDSEADLSNLLIMALKSINLASLRRSSCGLHKKGYLLPSDPWKTNFFGFCSEGITSTLSSMPESPRSAHSRLQG